MTAKNKDTNTNLNILKEKVRNFIEERGWSPYHTPKNLIQALQIEAAELSEILLFKNDDLDQILNNKQLMSQFSDEIADVLIYLLSLVNCLKIDLTSAFFKKMEKNAEKYPSDEFNNGFYYKK